MSTPTLTSTVVYPSSVTASTNWTYTTTSILSDIQSSTGTVERVIASTDPLTLALTTPSIPTGHVVWGFELVMAGCGVTVESSKGLPITISTADNGHLDFEFPLTVSTSSISGSTLSAYVQTTGPFSNLQGAIEWDITTMSITFHGLEDTLLYLNTLTLNILTFDPTDYDPVLYLPPIAKDYLGQLVEASGSVLDGAAFGLDVTGDWPDVGEIRISPNYIPLLSDAGGIAESGEVKMAKTDQGLILIDAALDPHDLYRIAARAGWYTPHGVERSDWNRSAVLYTRIGRPRAPYMTGALNADQVDFTLWSLDNMMSALYSGFSAPAAGWVDADVPFPGISGQAASVMSWSANADSSYTGEKNLRITSVSTNSITLSFPPIPVIAGKDYHLTVRVRPNSVDSSTTTIQTGFEWYTSTGGSNGSSTYSGSSVADNATATVSNQETAPASTVWAVPTIKISTLASGDVVDLYWISAQRYGTGIYGLCQGGFLCGNWTTGLGLDDPMTDLSFYDIETGSATVTTAGTTSPYKGTYNLAFVAPASTFAVLRVGDKKGGFLPEAWPGGSMTFSVWAIAASTNFGGIGVRWFDHNKKMIREDWGAQTSVASGSQTLLTVTAEVPEGAISYNLLVGIYGTTIRLDCFRVCFGDDTHLVPNTLESAINDYPGHYGVPYPTPAAWLAIERQLPGQDWVTIYMEPADPFADNTFTDYVKPEGWTAKYRACVYGLMNGIVVKGDYTSETQITSSQAESEEFSLWDPTQDLHLHFDIKGPDPQWRFSLLSDMGIYSPVGASRRVVTKDVSKGKTFQILADSVTEAELATWQTLHEERNVLIFARPSTEEVWSVIMTGDPQVTVMNTNPVRFELAVNLEEVDVPPVW